MPSYLHVTHNQAASAVELQQSAAAMIEESGGSASALTQRIASAGSRGRYPNNVPRDINRALQLPVVFRPILLAVFGDFKC